MKMMDVTPAAVRGSSRTSPRGKAIKPLTGQGPRLATIQMVATAIRTAKEYPSKYQLWRSLPKGMGYAKLHAVLNYLESTNQIMIDKDEAIIWILADNPKLKKLLAETKPF